MLDSSVAKGRRLFLCRRSRTSPNGSSASRMTSHRWMHEFLSFSSICTESAFTLFEVRAEFGLNFPRLLSFLVCSEDEEERGAKGNRVSGAVWGFYPIPRRRVEDFTPSHAEGLRSLPCPTVKGWEGYPIPRRRVDLWPARVIHILPCEVQSSPAKQLLGFVRWWKSCVPTLPSVFVFSSFLLTFRLFVCLFVWFVCLCVRLYVSFFVFKSIGCLWLLL